MKRKEFDREFVQSVQQHAVPILRGGIDKNSIYVFDLTERNQELHEMGIRDVEGYNNYIFSTMKKEGAAVGFGKYNETRTVYTNFDLFGAENPPRTVHMGIDVWVPAGTEILCPLPGRIHSFQVNEGDGNYGPTIILEHDIGGLHFHTLYGHLTMDSLEGIEEGQEIRPGVVLARIGDYPQNGNWPPHLHLQMIQDMKGLKGDFPGVCTVADRKSFVENCPDPNLLLQIGNLKPGDD